MKEIIAARREIDSEEFLGKQAQEGHYRKLIQEPVVVRERKGGPPVLACIQYGPATGDLEKALLALRFGMTSRTSGLTLETRMFGYAPRVVVRRDFCTATAMKRENPAEHAIIAGHAARVGEAYNLLNLDLWTRHHATTTEKVRPEYRLPGGVFTSGVCNRNAPIAYHYDRGNFPGVWSGMIVLKRDCGGGHLSLPEFGIGLELRDRTLLLFDGQSILHGVTPIALRGARAYRYSVVYYSLQAMWRCQAREDELTRIRRVKTERERRRAGVQA